LRSFISIELKIFESVSLIIIDDFIVNDDDDDDDDDSPIEFRFLISSSKIEVILNEVEKLTN
jgi:hypothetical protein